jgi:hypothetical protein
MIVYGGWHDRIWSMIVGRLLLLWKSHPAAMLARETYETTYRASVSDVISLEFRIYHVLSSAINT